MPDIKNNIKVIYNTLAKEGYNDLGTEQEFAESMADENNRKLIYNTLKGKEFADVKDYDSFSNMVYQQPKARQQQEEEIKPVEPARIDPRFVAPNVGKPTDAQPILKGVQQGTGFVAPQDYNPQNAFLSNVGKNYNVASHIPDAQQPIKMYGTDSNLGEVIDNLYIVYDEAYKKDNPQKIAEAVNMARSMGLDNEQAEKALTLVHGLYSQNVANNMADYLYSRMNNGDPLYALKEVYYDKGFQKKLKDTATRLGLRNTQGFVEYYLKPAMQRKLQNERGFTGTIDFGIHSGDEKTQQLVEVFGQRKAEEERLQQQVDAMRAEGERLEEQGERLHDPNYKNRPWWADLIPVEGGGRSAYDEAEGIERNPDAEKLMRTGQAMQRMAGDAQAAISEDNILRTRKTDGLTNQIKNAFGRILRGGAKTATDIRTWDFGFTDLKDATVIKAAADAYANNRATAAQKALLNAVALKNAVMGKHGDALGGLYGAAGTTIQMAPYMMQFAASPVKGVGVGFQKYCRTQLEKAFGKYATEAVGKFVIKSGELAGRFAGDVAQGAAMTTIFNMPAVAADTKSRMTGDLEATTDSKGNIVYSGKRTNVKSGGRAFAEAFTAQTIENQSELVGEYFAPLQDFIQKGAIKALDKWGLARTKDFLTGINNKQIMKGFNRFTKKTEWNKLLGETGEEFIGNIENAATVGDLNFKLDPDDDNSVFSKKVNTDIILGVGLGCGIISGARVGSYLRNNRKLNTAINDADTHADVIFGTDRWQQIKSEIDNAPDDKAGNLLQSYIDNTKLNNEQKQTIVDYTVNTYIKRGNDISQLKNAIEDNISSEQQEVQSAYENGQNARDAQMNEVKTSLDEAEKHAAELLGEDELNALDGVEDVDAFKESNAYKSYSEEQRETALKYIIARTAYNGMINRVQDEIKAAVNKTNAEIDNLTHNDSGTIIRAALKNGDQEVYVVSGNVATSPDGKSIDTEKSDSDIVVYNTENGKKEMLNIKDLQSVDTPIDAATYKADSAAETTRQIAEAEAAKIDGTRSFHYNDTVKVQDKEGNLIDGSVQDVTPDGVIVVSDAYPGGKTYTAEELTAMQPQTVAENTTVAQPAEEAATDNESNGTQTENEVNSSQSEATPQQETSATQQQAIPTDEKGNLLYHKAPVELTIKDLYDGTLDDAEIADFVSANIEAAQKEYDKVVKKAPKIGTDKARYLQEKKAYQAETDKAKAKVDYWQAVEDERQRITHTMPAEVQAKEDELSGEAARQDFRNGYDGSQQFDTAEDLTRDFLRSAKITPESFRDETGLPTTEQQKFVGTISKQGKTIAKLAEELADYDETSNGGIFFHGDSNAARSTIIDTLVSSRSRADFKAQTTRAEEDEYVRQAEQQREQWYYENYHMTYEEYLQYEETVLPELLRKYANFAPDIFYPQFAASFEDAYAAEHSQTNNTENNEQQGNDTTTEEQGTDRSTTVLQGEETHNSGRDSQSKEQGGEIPTGLQSEVENATVSETTQGEVDKEPLSEEAAQSLITSMEENAIEDPEIRLTPQTWLETFGINNSIDTPIGKVRMGENQYVKLQDKKRTSEFGMVSLTLSDPDVIFVEPSKAKGEDVAERNFSYVFAKTFKRNGNKAKYYTSVTVSIDGLEISVSSHFVNPNKMLNKLMEFNREYTKETLFSNSSEMRLAEHQSDVPDLLPTQENNVSSIGKDTQSSQTKQEKENKFSPTPRKDGESILDFAERVAAEHQSYQERKEEEAKVDTNPTEAQKEAGNYKKGHIKVDGLDITIEQPKGSIRRGTDANGKQWESEMHNTYGYIRGTESVDGDHIDIFLSDNPAEGNVFVVDQVNKDGSFDEHKVMYGFPDMESAKRAYLSNYEEGWQGLGSITEVKKEDFKKWIDSSKRKTKPFAEYSTVKTQGDVQTKKPTEAEDFTRQDLKELEDFQKNTDTTGRTAIDVDRYDAEDLFAPLKLEGKPSNLGILTVVPDKITDPAAQIAVYDYSDEIDDKTNSGWQKWGDLADEYNKTVDKDDKAQERGDTATLGFRTVDAAVKFNDWLNTDGQTKHQTKKSKKESKDNNVFLSQKEYVEKELKTVLKQTRYKTLEEWESKDVGDYSQKYDDLLDAYEDYVRDLADDERLQAIYDKSSVKAQKEMREHLTDADLDYHEFINTSPKRIRIQERLTRKSKYAKGEFSDGTIVSGEVIRWSPTSLTVNSRGTLYTINANKVLQQSDKPMNADGHEYQRDASLQYSGETLTNDTEAKQKATEAVLAALSKAGIEVVRATDEEAKTLLSNSHATTLRTPQGTIYGWSVNGKIYLTEAGINPDTPIHEYTHLWAEAMMIKNKKGWDSIKTLLKDTPVWKEVIGDPNYSDIKDNEDAVASEVLSRISGRKNAAKMEVEAQKAINEAKGVFEKAEATTVLLKLKKALKQFWHWVGKNVFGIKDFKNIDEVTDRVLYDLLNKTKLTEEDYEEIAKRDKLYLDAVERGDMETAQRMVNEAAVKNGYVSNSEYQGTSAFNGTAPYGNGYFFTKEKRKEAYENDEFDGNTSLDDYVNSGIDPMNLDYLTNDSSYRHADDARKEAIENLRDVLQNKRQTITMYRSVPSSVKEGSFRNGDWVTPSYAYAVENARVHGWGNKYRIIEQEVPISDVWFDGNDIAEFGYGNEDDFINDKDYLYSNTKNNRKLPNAVTYDDKGNIIPLSKRFNKAKSDPRFQIVGNSLSDEEKKIVETAKANGTYMKAPNGKPTNLSEKQWAQVRTKAFKNWFGDWEKAARIEKLRRSKAVKITEADYGGKYELTRNSAKQWAKDNIRGEYTIADTGEKVNVSKVSINEVLSHGERDAAHLKSISSIDKLLHNAIFIAETPNAKDNDKYESYRYYVEGIKIDGVNYTAKLVIGVKNGKTYYDHRLTQIEKGSLLDSLNGLSNSVAEKQQTSFTGKDSKLLSILQTNSSKVVDENGEPMVAYHGSNNEFTKFDTARIGSSTGTSDGRGFYFTTDKDYANSFGKDGNVLSVFLNIDNPLSLKEKTITKQQLFDIIKRIDEKEVAADGEHWLISNYANYYDVGIDGAIREAAESEYPYSDNDVELVNSLISASGNFKDVVNSVYEITGKSSEIVPKENGTVHYVVTNPNQIKSATGNNGNFSTTEDDILYRTVFGGNSGYVGYSMSKRAAEAKEEGRYPKTEFKREYHITEKSLDMLTSLGFIDNSEWHHTSMYGNKTPFYGWTEDEFADDYLKHKKEIDTLCKGIDPKTKQPLLEKVEKPQYEHDYELPQYNEAETAVNPIRAWRFKQIDKYDEFTDFKGYTDATEEEKAERDAYLHSLNEQMDEKIKEKLAKDYPDYLAAKNALDAYNNYEEDLRKAIGERIKEYLDIDYSQRWRKNNETEIGQASDFAMPRKPNHNIKEKLKGKSINRNNVDVIANRLAGFDSVYGLYEQIDYRKVKKTVDLTDYYNGTETTFKALPIKGFLATKQKWEELKRNKELEWHQSPLSNSEYLINRKTGDIYRCADHWGVVASCDWDITGEIPNEKDFYIGVSNIADFKAKPYGRSVIATASSVRACNQGIVNIKDILNDPTIKITPTARPVLERTLARLKDFREDLLKNNTLVAMNYRQSNTTTQPTADIETLIEHAESVVRNLHLDNVEIVPDGSSLDGRQATAKGFYNKRTGKIVVVASNHTDIADIEKTVLHEAVAHYGLRQLFGNDFDKFLDTVFAKSDIETRRQIAHLSAKHGWNVRTATEEYLASMAEDTNFEQIKPTLWQRIKQLFGEIMSAFGLHHANITDNDLRYMLWRSYKNLQNSGKHSILDKAEDIAMQYRLKAGKYADKFTNELNAVNERFNEELSNLTEENADKVAFWLGKPSKVLLAAGVEDKPMKLYGNKVIRKMKKHGFSLEELRNLPRAVADPIAVFDNIGREGNRSVLTELHTENGNFLVAIDLGKGKEDIDFNIISSVFGKGDNKVVDWINKGFATYINKEKALNYLHHSAPIAEALSNSRLSSAAKIIKDFHNPKLNSNVLYRSSIDPTATEVLPDARTRYEEETKEPDNIGSVPKTHNFFRRFYKSYVDSMLALKSFTNSVLEATGDKMASHEDTYKAENAMTSKNKTDGEVYNRDYYNPLLTAAQQLCEAVGMDYDALNMYMVAKHGLERNEYMGKRAAQNDENVLKAKKSLEDALAAYNEDPTSENEAAVQKAQEKYTKVYNKALEVYTNKDYSGLTELTDKEDVAEAEYEAQKIVDAVETPDAMPKVTAFWSKVNAATKQTLKTGYESGIMTKDTYEHILNMYKYYIPLRGWAKPTADDVYTYYNNRSYEGKPLTKTAKGRTSLAEDPMAIIASMAQHSIIEANRNKMKQTFLNFVLNHPTSLATVGEQWYIKNALGEWERSDANIPANATPDDMSKIIEEHELEMQRLAEQGTAIKQRNGLKLDKRVINGEGAEHTIKVWRGGKEYIIYINGNPAVAQAVNGLTNPDTQGSELPKWAEIGAAQLKNFLSGVYTSFSPAFVLTNFTRDQLFASQAVYIKYGLKYKRQASKNARNLFFSGALPRLVYKWEHGTLDMNDETERYFDEFMRGGGETGFTALRDIESIKKEVEDAINGNKANIAKRGWKSFINAVEFANRSAEDFSRFVTFMTSRQQGKNIVDAIYDAKDITVNFNKKGSGEMGSRFMNFAYIFFNAAVQSINNFGTMLKQHPARTMLVISKFGALGFGVPMLNAFLTGLCGGGDDDKYWDNMDWVRRNNIVLRIPFLEKTFISIPLPQELRPFYGMGEIAASILFGKETFSSGLQKAVEGFTGLLPIDFTGNGGNLPITLTPTVLQPVAQYMFNTDYFGRKVYNDNEKKKFAPGWTKAFSSTPPVLIEATKFLNSLTGGNDVDRGGVSLNPDVINHFVKGYFGGPATFVTQMSSLLYKGFSGNAKEIRWRDVPVASRFVQQLDERSVRSSTQGSYKDFKEETEETEYRLSNYKKQVKMGKMEYAKMITDLIKSPEYQRYKIAKAYKKPMDLLKETLNHIDNTTDKKEVEKALTGLRHYMMETVESEQKGKHAKREEDFNYLGDNLSELNNNLKFSLRSLKRNEEQRLDGEEDDGIEELISEDKETTMHIIREMNKLFKKK